MLPSYWRGVRCPSCGAGTQSREKFSCEGASLCSLVIRILLRLDQSITQITTCVSSRETPSRQRQEEASRNHHDDTEHHFLTTTTHKAKTCSHVSELTRHRSFTPNMRSPSAEKLKGSSTRGRVPFHHPASLSRLCGRRYRDRDAALSAKESLFSPMMVVEENGRITPYHHLAQKS